jgi:hypothetical protein
MGVFSDEKPKAITLSLLPGAALLRIWTKIVSNSRCLIGANGNWHMPFLFAYCPAASNNNCAAQ